MTEISQILDLRGLGDRKPSGSAGPTSKAPSWTMEPDGVKYPLAGGSKEERLAKLTFDRGVYYQGVGAAAAKDRQAHGMDPLHKVGTSVHQAVREGYFEGRSPEAFQEFVDTASRHFYFTKLREGNDRHLGAYDYAKLA